MDCAKCGTANADSQKYCGECGSQLRTTSAASEADLRQQCQAIIRQELKDRNLVEIEITEAIVTRITNWTRLLGYFAGIPLAILILILSALGIKNYTDVSATATAAEREMAALAEKASKQVGQQVSLIENASKEGNRLDKQAAILRAKLDELGPKIAKIETSADAIAATAQQVKDLAGTVTEIQKRIAKPGIERWAVKTGQDSDARLVVSAEKAVPATVESLARLSRPSNIPPDRRVPPVELTIYKVEADLTALKLEADGDYHMVLEGKSGATMVAEVPLPATDFIGTSRWSKEIALARKNVDQRVPPGAGVIRWHGRVRVTGVGFFDYPHGQMGMAENAIELHPVIDIEFLRE